MHHSASLSYKTKHNTVKTICINLGTPFHVRCSPKAIKLNHSLTPFHVLVFSLVAQNKPKLSHNGTDSVASLNFGHVLALLFKGVIWPSLSPHTIINPTLQYIPRNMHTVFALLCFVVVIHWLIFQYPSGLLHWHCGNLTIAPVPAKQPWWIWINISCEFIMNDCITTTKQSTTKPCAYFLGYTVLTYLLVV